MADRAQIDDIVDLVDADQLFGLGSFDRSICAVHMERSLESGGRISIKIRRMSPIDGKEYAAHHRGTKTRGIGYEQAQPASCAGRSQRGQMAKKRKIVEGENDLTRLAV